MKIYAKESLKKIRVGAQKYPLKYKDPLDGGPNRISKLAEFEENAMAFVNKLFIDLDIPSVPEVTLGNLKGFEDVTKDLNQVVGTILVYAAFHTPSGHKVRIELPIPVSYGEMHKPSIMVIDGKKAVFSQAAISKIVAEFQGTNVKFRNMYSPDNQVQHSETQNKGIFQVPEGMVVWYEGY